MSLIIGEALVDIITASDGTTTEYVGGSPLNVAIGLGRLGRPVEFVTRIGDDTRGAAIVRHLEQSGVSLAAGSITAQRTATAHATLDDAGSATYEFDLEWDLPSPSGASAPPLVHTGSIAAVLEPGCDVVADMLDRRRSRATVSYDPNVRPVLITDRARARQHSAQNVREAMAAQIGELPEALARSITWDQGTEMTQHAQFTIDTGVQIYFCDPHSPWQRCTNENTNGSLRQYFPKGTDLTVHSAEHLRFVADELNDRPRKPTSGILQPRSSTNYSMVQRPHEFAPVDVVGDHTGDAGALSVDAYDGLVTDRRRECVAREPSAVTHSTPLARRTPRS